jgi:hypothetical protein
MAALPKRCLAVAVAVAAVAATATTTGCGSGRSLGGGGTPDAGSPTAGADLTGRWAMFEWEDPVIVDLRQTGGALAGGGCCGSLSDQSYAGECCGAVSGQVADRRASFGFAFDFSGEHYDYSTDVFVSADGQRMTGTFSWAGFPVAWVRIPSTDPRIPAADPALQQVIDAHACGYTIVLSDDPAPGGDFEANHTYMLGVADQYVAGDLGAFWSGEMSWNAAEQTLTTGPVPETAPSLPVALSLRFDGATLVSVEATMVSGVRYDFQATHL